MVSVVLGGRSLALLAVGFAGWAKEFFQHGAEEGLGPIAVAAFIVSKVVIFWHGVRCVLAELRYSGLPGGRRHWSGGHVVWYAWIW